MRSVIFLLSTGADGGDWLNGFFQDFLPQRGWRTVHRVWNPCKLDGARENYEAVKPGLDSIKMHFSAVAEGLIETSSTFIKDFSQLAFVAFSDALRVIHLVRDPMQVARIYTANQEGPMVEKRVEFHIVEGSHIKFRSEWTLFQKNLWEWIELQIRSVLFAQQVRDTHVFRMPFTGFADDKLLVSLLSWIVGKEVDGTDVASAASALKSRYASHSDPVISDQQTLESFSFLNSITASEKRLVVMMFRELMRLKMLVSPPAFVSKLI